MSIMSLALFASSALAGVPVEHRIATSTGVTPKYTPNAAGVNDLPYPKVPMRFSGEIHGVHFEANGTIQQVKSQFYTAHPEFTPSASGKSTTNSTAAAVEKRNKSDFYCYPVSGQNWGPALTVDSETNSEWLKDLGPGAKCKVDKRSCTTIACTYQAAAVLCNDNDWEIEPSCMYLATYVDDINIHCTYYVPGPPFSPPTSFRGGQEFDTDRYNVIVKSGC